MTIRAYSRCTSGHYFEGEDCPFCGWSGPTAVELAQAVRRLEQLGKPVSLEELRRQGASEETLARAIVIEFGSAESAFEAISPKEYIVKGARKPPMKLGKHFK
ncbi:MAG: hypothetical protein KatS3mg105_1772 [Gemmatales bacterium]|nr:MAG: hypothetical protein KatS3mg105_1772 [Gemmatales bacterium]